MISVFTRWRKSREEARLGRWSSAVRSRFRPLPDRHRVSHGSCMHLKLGIVSSRRSNNASIARPRCRGNRCRPVGEVSGQLVLDASQARSPLIQVPSGTGRITTCLVSPATSNQQPRRMCLANCKSNACRCSSRSSLWLVRAVAKNTRLGHGCLRETQPVFWGNLAMPRWAATLELLREPGPAWKPSHFRALSF